MNCVVVSPEYGEVIPILDDGSGPIEYACDVCLVLGAQNRQQAKWAAYRKFKAEGTAHAENTSGPYGKHPLSGLRIEPYPTEAEWPGDDGPPDESFADNLRSWGPFVVDLRGVA